MVFLSRVLQRSEQRAPLGLWRRYRPLALLSTGLLLVGCASDPFFTERRAKLQHEAGSVHFAVLSVSPWAQTVASLQPDFELDSAEALAKVLPATRIDADAQIRHFRGSLQATGKGPGAAEPPAVGSGPSGHGPAPPVPPDFEVQSDPMLEYWSATALYQEVQLLNRYVRDAALRDGWDAYVVRLQVSLMPRARHEPYDAYVMLSFFTGHMRGTPATQARGSSGSSGSSPQIVPLLVTDNLEMSLRSRMLEDTRRLALSLSGAYTGPEGSYTSGVAAKQFHADLRSLYGADLNSVLTVARVSDNTIRVRLGAMQQAGSNYAMIPRNHNISLLMMVPPDSGRSMKVIARSTLVDVETGEELPARSSGDISRALARLSDDHALGLDAASMRQLLLFAQRNDQTRFGSAYLGLLGIDHPALPYWQQVWLDLVSLMVGGQYGATEFDLPGG